MRILQRFYNMYDISERVFKDSKKERLRKWVWYNTPHLLLIGVILLWCILIYELFCYGACTDSGVYYNHLNDGVSIIGGLLS